MAVSEEKQKVCKRVQEEYYCRMDKKQAIGSITSVIAGTGLQLSDWHNSYVAGACFVLAAILGVYSIHDWFQVPMLLRTMIPLDEASRRAYEQLRGTLWASAAERLNIQQTPEGIQEYIAQGIAGEIELFGTYLPSTKMERIRERDINAGNFTDGGQTLELRNQTRTIIKNVSVRRSDLKRAIAKMRETK
jgi:hypothetical protein